MYLPQRPPPRPADTRGALGCLVVAFVVGAIMQLSNQLAGRMVDPYPGAPWIVPAAVAAAALLVILALPPLRRRGRRFLLRSLAVVLRRHPPTLAVLERVRAESFAIFCSRLLAAEGYRTRLVPRDGAFTVELEHGRKGGGIAELSRSGSEVGTEQVRSFHGRMRHELARYGVLMTTGRFTKDATLWASLNGIRLIGGEELVDAAARYGIGVREGAR